MVEKHTFGEAFPCLQGYHTLTAKPHPLQNERTRLQNVVFVLEFGSDRRAAVGGRAAAVGVGGYADDAAERAGKFAGVVVSELPGDIEHRPVGGTKKLRRGVHFLSAQKRRRRHAVNALEALQYLRGRGVELCGELRRCGALLRCGEQILAHGGGKAHLRAGIGRAPPLGRERAEKEQQLQNLHFKIPLADLLRHGV